MENEKIWELKKDIEILQDELSYLGEDEKENKKEIHVINEKIKNLQNEIWKLEAE